MPSDITGTDILQEDPETGRKNFQFVPGPIFANMLLADEINRTPPKPQAALLEAMQEKQVTVGTQKYPIEKPFFVLATQNPCAVSLSEEEKRRRFCGLGPRRSERPF